MIVVDSSVWISHFRNIVTPQVAFLRDFVNPRDVIVGDSVLLELLQGVSSERQARLIETELRKFVIRPMFGEIVAINAAQNYRMLRQKGITIRKTMDLIIGTFSIIGGHQLLHQDRDFNAMRDHLGLQVVHTSGVSE
jgi:predicted nucleic acid-binding protein